MIFLLAVEMRFKIRSNKHATKTINRKIHTGPQHISQTTISAQHIHKQYFYFQLDYDIAILKIKRCLNSVCRVVNFM